MNGIRQIERRSSGGFTLIEIVIVIAIIAAIAAFTIPNLLSGRKSANEAATVSALRAISTAQDIFRTRDGDGDQIYDFAVSLAELHAAGKLIDDALASGKEHGYLFEMYPFTSPDNVSRWQVLASPVAPGRSGNRYFFVDETGVIRANDTGFTTGMPPVLVGPAIGG